MFKNHLQIEIRADNLTICNRKKQIDVSFSCVCPVIDHEFCHNIDKVAVDPQGDSRVAVNLLFTITNCQIVRSCLLTHRISYKFTCLSAY